MSRYGIPSHFQPDHEYHFGVMQFHDVAIIVQKSATMMEIRSRMATDRPT